MKRSSNAASNAIINLITLSTAGRKRHASLKIDGPFPS